MVWKDDAMDRRLAASPIIMPAFLTLALLLGLPAGCASSGDTGGAETPANNTLSEQERADGWELLFDGKSLDKWRGYKQDGAPDGPPEGWAVEDGSLTRVGPGGDIITRERFDDFELSLEWKISEGGNSGIIYNVVEDYDTTYMSGPEFQVLDNGAHNDGKNTTTSAGANYALHAPAVDATKPVGEFNHAVIRIKGNHVEHHLNGRKLLEYELGSEAWKALVAASKFKDMPGYGKASKGHIALQNHGDKVWYRNIKIRRLEGNDE